MVTALGTVRMMEPGVVVIPCVVEVSSLSHTVTFRLLHSDICFIHNESVLKGAFFLYVSNLSITD